MWKDILKELIREDAFSAGFLAGWIAACAVMAGMFVAVVMIVALF